MRIGLDLQVLAQKPWTGIGKYAYHLAEALLELKSNHEFVFFKSDSNDANDHSNDSNEFVDSNRCKVVYLPRKRIPIYDNHIRWGRMMIRENLDVLHGPANVFPLTLSPSPPRGGEGRGEAVKPKLVLTIHDLAIYKHPEWFARGQWFSTKIVVPASVRKADHIIVPSEATKRDLMEMFNVPENKITVIPHGVSDAFFVNGQRRASPTPSSASVRPPRADGTTADRSSPPSLREGEKVGEGPQSASRKPIRAAPPYNGRHYILFVGTLEPRKNVARLIEAYLKLPQDIRDEYDLVIAGAKGWGEFNVHGQRRAYRPASDALRKTIPAAPPYNAIRYLDYVPDDQLPALYQNASVFVYPSLYEGFGLPVLEAMAAGVPVITSKGTAMEELGGESEVGSRKSDIRFSDLSDFLNRGSAILVDPHSVDDIAAGITRLIRDSAYARQISAAGQKLARQFTWEKTAQKTLKVYEIALR